jgi:hypothetical protein
MTQSIRPFVLVAFACLPPAAAVAQDTADGQVWIQGVALGRLSEHWRSHIEVQPRWFDDASELGLVIVRSAIGRQATPRLTIWFGYAWVPRTLGEGVRHEQRIWEQLSMVLPEIAGWRPTARIRLEQRWQPDPWDGTSHRLRMMARAQRSLRSNSRWQLATYDELMVTLDETRLGPRQGFDRNRLYGGIVRTVNPWVTLEGGYIWEHTALPVGRRNDHVALGVVTLQWPRLSQ